MQITVTVPPIEYVEAVSANQVHIVNNTGKGVDVAFLVDGVRYVLADCDLSPGKYIDTICTLKAPANL